MQCVILGAALIVMSVGWGLTGTAVPHAESVSDSDRQFLVQAASSGMAEVQLGQLATQRAASVEVKQFGQRMVDDHTKANTELLTLAQAKNGLAGVSVQKPTVLPDKKT